jgi:hypothetical protein
MFNKHQAESGGERWKTGEGEGPTSPWPHFNESRKVDSRSCCLESAGVNSAGVLSGE